MLSFRRWIASIFRSKRGAGARLRPRAWCGLAGLLALPALLSPEHPVAVYGYLGASTLSVLVPPAQAANQAGLEDFLVSEAQVARYRTELVADLVNPVSGGLFAIARDQHGTLRHAPIRSWNGSLPHSLPGPLRRWLDRKEFPRLDDHVALWLRGEDVIALGHYHAFGGGPSKGDRVAQVFRETPEVVVANGIIPIVYLGGLHLPYGPAPAWPEDVVRLVRPMETNLAMDPECYPLASGDTAEFANSYLAYLARFHEMKSPSRAAVAQETIALCQSFEEVHRSGFTRGFKASRYQADLDRMLLIRHVAALKGWGDVLLKSPRLL